MRLVPPQCLLPALWLVVLSTMPSPSVPLAGVHALAMATSPGQRGPLLACGTRGDDSANTQQLIELFGFVKRVCVDQLGESYNGVGYLPSSCETEGCQRATELLVDSCAIFFQGGFVASIFQPMLAPFARTCVVEATQRFAADPPRRQAITAPATATGSSLGLFTTGTVLTDGMGRGGHNAAATGLDETTMRAAPRQAVTLALRALWLPPGFSLAIYVDESPRPAVQLAGQTLPSQAEGGRVYQSKVGGSIRVQLRAGHSATVAGQPVFFELRVQCAGDLGCSGHGTCDEAAGTCACQAGWTGSACDEEFFPHSNIIVNTTWPGILNRWVEAAGADEAEVPRSRAEQRWALCYSSFTDYAASPSVFHRQCDNYTTTLVVARNSLGYTFGGYAVRSWSVDRCCAVEENKCIQPIVGHQIKYCYDTSATADFTFRLAPGGTQQFQPRLSPDLRYQYLKADIWPAWGIGDLAIGHDGGHIGSESACCLKKGYYTCTPTKQHGGLCGSDKQARAGHWGQTDMEVWRPL
jgi:hypothetical protein